LAAKGLFPGRGMPGAAAGVAAGVAGVSGFASGVAVGSTGLALTSGFSSTTGSAVSALAALALVGFSTLGSSAFGLAFGYAARSLLATGGAMVDEPLLTYSPKSFSLANASAVSIPSSLAMSYTRGSAT
jgi:hypothetical protein